MQITIILMFFIFILRPRARWPRPGKCKFFHIDILLFAILALSKSGWSLLFFKNYTQGWYRLFCTGIIKDVTAKWTKKYNKQDFQISISRHITFGTISNYFRNKVQPEVYNKRLHVLFVWFGFSLVPWHLKQRCLQKSPRFC